MYLSVCMWTMSLQVSSAGRLLDPLEMALQVVVSCPVWVLGTELGSFASSKCSQLLSHLSKLVFWDRVLCIPAYVAEDDLELPVLLLLPLQCWSDRYESLGLHAFYQVKSISSPGLVYFFGAVPEQIHVAVCGVILIEHLPPLVLVFPLWSPWTRDTPKRQIFNHSIWNILVLRIHGETSNS